MSPWFNFAVALLLGLLIGIERERSKGEGPGRRPAGIRTFALATLLGAIAIHLGGPLLLAIATGGIATLTALSHARSRDDDPGLTTEVGLVTAPLVGAAAMSDPLLASALSATIAVIFAVKAPLHGFVKGVLTDDEVKDGLIFAVATLVVWPQLPDRYLGPFGALIPHSIWLLVVLMLGIGACGHIATRVLGPRFGLPVAGLAAGFVSSTATIGSMASRAGRDPTIRTAAVVAAAFSTVSTFVQMALILLAVSKATLGLMTPALACGGMASVIYGLVFALRGLTPSDIPAAEPGRAFSFGAALILAAVMTVMLIVAAALKDWLGEAGIIVGAAVAGSVDTHSAAISVASLAASGRLEPHDAVIPILVAMTANTSAKIVMAMSAGSGGFAARIIPCLVISMAAAWIAAVFALPR